MATRKPVAQLSPAFRHRLEAYAADHPGADLDDAAVRKAARGHGQTPEHGAINDVRAYNDRTIITTNSGQEARRLLAGAARANVRVSFAVEEKGKPGQWRHLYSSHGERAQWLMRDKRNPDRVGRESNLKKWLERQEFGGSGGRSPGGYYPRNIKSIQVTIYKAQPKAA